MKAYPKIFALGTDYIRDIFNEPVEITEKIDGSQFGFGMLNGELYFRSKGKRIFPDYPEKMFLEAIEYISSIQDRLPENVMFYAEYLKKPRHNMLAYERTPKNHLILFGATLFPTDFFIKEFDSLIEYASEFEIEVIPRLSFGKINSPSDIHNLLEVNSILGGVKVEGIVVKNYERKFLLGGQPMPLMAGKFVRESFKEVLREKWGKENTGKGRWTTFVESFKTEARWHKAIQHLAEKGELENSPRDIGKLIKEIQIDIESEEKEAIKEVLWKEFGKEVTRQATKGFPEWYKEQLLERNF